MTWQMMAAAGGAAAIVLFILLAVVIHRKRHRRTASEIGTDFEKYCAELLWKCGFSEVELTKASGDFGVDVFAKKEGVSWAFQCKCYEKPVGIHAVQEIYSGRDFYHCMVGVVVTNNTFTGAAVKLAEAHNILLWDGETLRKMAKQR